MLLIVHFLQKVVVPLQIVKQKVNGTILSAIGVLFSALFSFFSYVNISIPMPTILALDNGSQTYNDNVEISIISDEKNSFKIYYSLDGTDPKNGIKYEKEFSISESTTVCARNRFLWLWSDIKKEPYKFEKLIIDDETESADKNIDKSDTQEDTITPESDTSNEDKDDEANEQDSKNTHQIDTQPEEQSPVPDPEPEPSTDSTTTPTQTAKQRTLLLDSRHWI